MFEYGNLQSSDVSSPQTSVHACNPSNESQGSIIQTIVDTGAVKTCIPESTVEHLGDSLAYSEVLVRDANGNLTRRKTYFVDITIANNSYSNIEVVAIPKEYGLIGRDILNQERVVLNAPEEKWAFDCNNKVCPHYNTFQ